MTVLRAELYILASKYLHRRGRIISCGSWEATDGAGSSLDDCVSSSCPDESFMVSSLSTGKQTRDQLFLVTDTILAIFSPKWSMYQPQISFRWLEVNAWLRPQAEPQQKCKHVVLFIDQDFKQINLKHSDSNIQTRNVNHHYIAPQVF